MPSFTSTLFFFFFSLLIVITCSIPCNETCGVLQTHFPFYINNSSCGLFEPDVSASNSSHFQLLCVNSTTLCISIATQVYRVLEFYPDGVVVDFPGISTICHPYNDFNSFGFHGNAYLGISSDNVVGLYDCEDSSLCKAYCEGIDLTGCDNSAGNRPSCCYPLFDHSVWSVGDEFSVFKKYECRGVSSWVVPRGMNSGRRGVKLDWVVPRNLSKDTCHVNAHTVNSTIVKDGIRCVCDDGFSGDGFKNGSGCFKSCFKEAYGNDCGTRGHDRKRTMIILAGVLTLFVTVASLFAFICFVKKKSTKDTLKGALLFQKGCRVQVFALVELDEATNGFSAEQKLTDLYNGSVYVGSLEDGTRVAVHKLHCENNENDLMQFLNQIELLSNILHRHVAQILGCCIHSEYTPMVVYGLPENGSLAHHIHMDTAETKDALDWYKRLTIAAENASTLAFLQHEILTPVYHYNPNTCCIFLDGEFSAKLACFELIHPRNPHHRSDVYDFGVVLLEMLSGSRHYDLPAIALEKMRDGNVEEIVDPLLYYHEQPTFGKEQLEMMADVATRCLLFGGGGAREVMQGGLRKLEMVDVARDLMRAADGGGITIKEHGYLEETFSSSSLLQMISMSPDSIYAPKK